MLTRRQGTPGTGPLPRCLAVWATVSLLALALVRSLAPDLEAGASLVRSSGRAGVPFDAWLTTGCGVLLAGCACWFWLVTTAVVVEAATGRPRRHRGCPAAVRRWVLVACGAALVAGATPATAADGQDGGVAAAHGPGREDRSALAGLPLPDRPTGPPQHTGPVPLLDGHAAREVRVAPGDTLWEVAARDLPGATAAAVDRRWRLIWQVNRGAVGPDPDVIQPGTHLRLPPREDA